MTYSLLFYAKLHANRNKTTQQHRVSQYCGDNAACLDFWGPKYGAASLSTLDVSFPPLRLVRGEGKTCTEPTERADRAASHTDLCGFIHEYVMRHSYIRCLDPCLHSEGNNNKLVVNVDDFLRFGNRAFNWVNWV